jgi:hypothetical protein
MCTEEMEKGEGVSIHDKEVEGQNTRVGNAVRFQWMQGKRKSLNINRNNKNPKDGSAELQRRQRETDEREKLDKCSSVVKKNEEGIKLNTRGRR